MARVRWNTATLPRFVDSMWSNTEDWQDIRKAPLLVTMFEQMGGMWVSDLNRELHAAQTARKQKVEDGYKFAISVDRDRIRMRIWAFTARAMAHEAKHQSILTLMRHSGFDFKGKGRAEWDWGRKSRSKTTGGGSRKGTSSSAGGRRSRGRSSGRSSAGGRHTTTSPPRASRPRMDPAKEARMRRQLATMDLLAKDKGATEDERKLAAERARRFRTELGD